MDDPADTQVTTGHSFPAPRAVNSHPMLVPPGGGLSSGGGMRKAISATSLSSMDRSSRSSHSPTRRSRQRTSSRYQPHTSADHPLRRYTNLPIVFPIPISILCTERPEYDELCSILEQSPNSVDVPHTPSPHGERYRVFESSRMKITVSHLGAVDAIDMAVRTTQFFMAHPARFATMIGLCSGIHESELGRIFLVTKAYFPQIMTRNSARRKEGDRTGFNSSPLSLEIEDVARLRISFDSIAGAVAQETPQSMLSAATDQAVCNAAELFCMTLGEKLGCETSEIVSTTMNRADVDLSACPDVVMDTEAYSFLHSAETMEVPVLPLFFGVSEYSHVDCAPFMAGVAARAARTCYEFLTFADERDMWELM